MHKAYLIGHVNIRGPIPVITKVGIYSENSPTCDLSETRWMNIAEAEGDSFQNALDNLVKMMDNMPDWIGWVYPLLTRSAQNMTRRRFNDELLWGC
mgnify:CR=1 FL=1